LAFRLLEQFQSVQRYSFRALFPVKKMLWFAAKKLPKKKAPPCGGAFTQKQETKLFFYGYLKYLFYQLFRLVLN